MSTNASRTALLLDGGTGQELARRGLADSPLWSTEALLDAPEVVREVHESFLRAGADVVTTNSYAISRYRLRRAGLDMAPGRLGATAARIARDAVDRAGRPGARVAASLGPLRGSYAPEAVPDEASMREEYTVLLQHMADDVDIVLAETFTTVREGRAAAAAAAAAGLPLWVAWTVQTAAPGHLPDGTPLAEVPGAVDAELRLLNCAPPEVLDRELPAFLAATPGPFGAYANGFSDVPVGWSLIDGDPLPGGRNDLDPDTYAAHVRGWLDLGASVVGGCCEVGPAHITAVRAMLDGDSSLDGDS